MNLIFLIVYSLLKGISRLTGFSYTEVNIIAYYILLPFLYVVLLDRILARRIGKKHILKTLYILGIAVTLLLIQDFTAFSDWLFQKSVDFLLSFQLLGWNYIVSSVLICVLFPLLVFLLMSHLAFPTLIPTIARRLSPPGEPPGKKLS